ncbi:pyrroline-5-carboxylate reductase [Nasonia vitripennis]|uniref:Pyrroline-5-carboxylate reductase n=1 Tax=Nasonia vitripennis TaxID=7425 RepID=A0A7M7TCD7_NASVI|nr:pyrroline-5-carboxylate reductase [Nasonia vitripennis]XP_031780319.1 pyrroline-5-carboxylate reductase [Nasonia vitripennis]XP_031780320.1 pyrroline-5-carboxylate reductase [Nasonia vitripennis]XP_032453209.1 pyrroline-5-carboxylate reductase [Nasonia vitripennis]
MVDFSFLINKNVGFVGGGNMAQAIGLGLVKKGVIKPNNIWVSSRTEKTLSVWESVGINITFNNYEVVQNSDVIFLAVKPQMLDEALRTCKPPHHTTGKLFVSVIVGIPLDTLDEKLRAVDSFPKIIRSMPSTPMMVGEGITVYCSLRTNEEEECAINYLFSQLGLCEKIPESLMNSAGGLSGSGPAYAYMIIEALADGAVKKGIPRASATRFAAQVLVGAGKMVLETGKHPGLLKDEVCSPGGSTITGVHAMETGGVRAAMMNAVEAAVNKSNELTSLLGKK